LWSRGVSGRKLSNYEIGQSGNMNRPLVTESHRNPYRGVLILLFAAALAGMAGAIASGAYIDNPVVYGVAITLGLSAGVLAGVIVALMIRARPPLPAEEEAPQPETVGEIVLAKVAGSDVIVPLQTPATSALPPPHDTTPPNTGPPDGAKAKKQWAEVLLRGPVKSGLQVAVVWIRQWLHEVGPVGIIRVGTAILGVMAIAELLWRGVTIAPPVGLVAGIEAAVALVAAGLVSVGVRYLSGIESAELPESPGLVQGARIVAWILVLAAISAGVGWLSQLTILQVLFFVILAIDATICYGLFRARRPADETREVFPLNLGVLPVLGRRTNILASVQDAVEAQFGIDLRSTWALTVVRRGLEPLVMGLCVVGWLSTSLTVVAPDEQGLVEHSGVAAKGAPLEPGLHIHWPWPVDQVFRIPVKHVDMLTVGHEGEEEGGPENVLWAYKHAENEYTLLLGNGRDLLTVDAQVQFRVADAHAWRYNCQNPAEALKALSYRAVTRSIVSRTLADALSENVAAWTGQMKAEIQRDANRLGLGIEVLGFTVGGMHPPVNVATDYQAVVSAELRKVTAVVNAQAFRNRTLPDAQASVLTGEATARSDAADAIARAAGEAWSFRALESQYRASPEEYYFRRRLETLEKGLAAAGPFTVVDSRFQRDGGELWVIP
jgi:regulator of protease activity HflC (stomatin/prohibitin superfamily)